MGSDLDTYARWHHLQVATGDLDPTYPVYRSLIDTLALDADQAAWLVILHVTYYDVGSAMRAFRLTDGAPAADDLDVLCGITRTGTERRGHRDPAKLRAHLRALLATVGPSPAAWLAQDWSWPALTARIASIHGNGRWAAYKEAEMCQKVLGAPTSAPDAGHAHSSGPRKGLMLLYGDLPTDNSARSVAILDAVTEGLAQRVGEPDIAQVETSLCDFHSLTKGGYYLGHDIDAHLAQTHRADPEDRAALFAARRAVFPEAYLGEAYGWTGVDPARKTVFRDTGDIVERP